MSIEGQGHFFTIYFPGFVCFVLYKATISGERLQDHWFSGYHITCIICSSVPGLWRLSLFVIRFAAARGVQQKYLSCSLSA